jgi:hypothetical protein
MNHYEIVSAVSSVAGAFGTVITLLVIVFKAGMLKAQVESVEKRLGHVEDAVEKINSDGCASHRCRGEEY